MTVLSDVKQYLGIDPEDTTFDADVMMHIDSALAVLNDLGACGPLTCTPKLEWSSVYWDPRLDRQERRLPPNQTGIRSSAVLIPCRPLEKVLSEYKYRIRDIAEEAK